VRRRPVGGSRHAEDAGAGGGREGTRPARAEPPLFTIESALPLDEAFHELEEHDLERVPVVEDGRLVGVLSRAVLKRRLAEDEPVPDPVEL
jgi:CBS domain-containing protein